MSRIYFLSKKKQSAGLLILIKSHETIPLNYKNKVCVMPLDISYC
jgi:hypothetical protein